MGRLARLLTSLPLTLLFAAAVVTTLALLPTIAAGQMPSDTDPADGNRALFANFLHNSVLGKFEVADAYAKKLIANQPDPLEVLRYADEHTNSLKTLILLVNKVGVSESAKRILGIIHEGELQQRRDPQRIKLNISKLGGDPQTEFNAINRLRDSGEYAVPWLVRALEDRTQSQLHNRIIRMLPKMGKDAVNPLVMALKMDDAETKQFLVRALGEIGYPQALPYMLAVLESGAVSPELQDTIHQAILQIMAGQPSISSMSAGTSFLELARQYYNDHGSVKADPRYDTANVWYWREGRVQRVEVPREIFNEIMAMRCSEEALRLEPDTAEAVAIWLAANIRREAELGLDVESVVADSGAQADPTKPQDFPRSAYFARSAGARYCQMVLDLAVRDREPALALGAIAALRLVAGETSLVDGSAATRPLVDALTFPDLVVRLKAALALAHALPTSSFVGSDRVVPALGEALSQTGGQFVLVVESDENNLNRVMSGLRDERTMAVGAANLYDALDRARRELPTISAVLLGSDVSGPELSGAVGMIRSNNLYAMTPVVILMKEAQADQASALANADPSTEVVPSNADAQDIRSAWESAGGTVGPTRLSPDDALALALDAIDALRRIALSQSPVYDDSLAGGALIRTLLAGEVEELRTACAAVLALSEASAAQQAIAKVALDALQTESLRVAAFSSLADSAKINGNMLSDELTDRLIDLAIHEENLVLRSAGSQALGALNLPTPKVIPIIDKFYQG